MEISVKRNKTQEEAKINSRDEKHNNCNENFTRKTDREKTQ